MSGVPRIAEIDGLPALVVPTGEWRDEYREIVLEENLAALSVRVSGNDLGFLRDLRGLRGLVLNASSDLDDLTALEALSPHLETLTLNTPKHPRLSLDFSSFPKLRRLGMYWNSGFESIFACTGLEKLYVFDPPDPDLARFGQLKGLRRLELSEGRKLEATTGVDGLRQLSFLGVYHQSSLRALTSLDQAVALRSLAVESCKNLRDIAEVASLERLVTLKLANCGEVSSLRPLESLVCLERFFAWESTRIMDNDLAVLTQLPRLREVAMMPRRSYRPSVQEVEALLDGRRSGPRTATDD